MRTHRQLLDRLVDADHLERAAARTVRGKRRRPDVAWFLFRRDRLLESIRVALAEGTWQPQGFTLVHLRDPKPRVIARAPVEDRVVHSAIALLCEPIVLRSASECDYACRPGFGTHRAVLRLLRALAEHRFAVHLDVRSYFPSIRLDVLRSQLARRIDDDRFLELVDRILASGRGLYDSPAARRHARMDPDWPPAGRGLPMGAVTSQLFAAHLFLQEFDHWVKRELKVASYVRYVDDLFVFGDRRGELRRWRAEIGKWLAGHLDLRLKHPEAPILSCKGHLDALGFRLRRGLIEPLPAALRRLRGRLGRHVRGMRGPGWRANLGRSIESAMGHLFFG